MEHDVIFTQIRFMDSEGHCYGKIEEAEFDGETFVFIPTNTNEIDPKMFTEVNRIINLLNNNKERKQHE